MPCCADVQRILSGKTRKESIREINIVILDTFYTLFKADSTDLQKGAKEAVKTTDQVEKSLKSADKASDKLGVSFGRMINQAAYALTALFSVGAVISGIRAATEYTSYLSKMSEHLGYNVQAIEMWQGAVIKAGGDALKFQTTIQNLDISIRDIAKTGEGEAAKAFKKLGINIKDAQGNARTFLSVMPDIARAFEGLSKTDSSALGYQLGLDYGTIMLLQKSKIEIDALIEREKELGLITKKDTEVAQKFNLQVNDTSHAFRSLFVQISTEVLPVFEKVYKFFERVAISLRENKHLAIGTVIGIVASITSYLIPSFLGLGNAAGKIGKVFGKWTILLAIIGAISSAIGILYDDFVVFQKGGDSVIGDLVKKYPELIEIFNAIGDAISFVSDIFKKFNITPLGVLVTALNAVLHVITSIYDGIKAGWDLLGQFGRGVKSVVSGVESISGKVLNTIGINPDNASQVATSLQQFDKSPINSQVPGSISNSSRSSSKTANVTTGPVTINTQATNSEEISAAFSKNLSKQMDQALNDYDDGVVA